MMNVHTCTRNYTRYIHGETASMTVIICVYTTCPDNKGRWVRISAGVNVCVCVCVFHLDVIRWAENKKINCVSMDKQILLCSRCDLGPLFPMGTNTTARNERCYYPHTYKSTSASTHWRTRQGGGVKRGQSLVFVLSVCSVQQAASPMENAHRWQSFRDGKINVADSKIGCCFRHIKRLLFWKQMEN